MVRQSNNREEQHPDWVANIVPVLKKNGKIKIYIDYHDLNAACPKDEFPLLITDVILTLRAVLKAHIFQNVFWSILLHSDAL